jgi:ferredoxin/flavodoxin
MKIAMIVFSQSGNTRRVAETLATGFREAGPEASIFALDQAASVDLAEFDLIGVGSPCFSSRAPQPMLDFIAGLPSLAGKDAFVFATSGGGPGRVLYEMTSALRGKQAAVRGGILIRGECFHPFPALKGRFPGRPDARDLAAATDFARALHQHLVAGRPGPLPSSRPDALGPGHGFYDFVAVTVTDAQLRRLVPAPVADHDLCTQCGLCESECPTGSISLDPYPAIGGDRCLRCYRCCTGCPEQAFRADLWLGNFLAHLCYNRVFERWLGDVKAGEKFY